jgi:hypothetical protein
MNAMSIARRARTLNDALSDLAVRLLTSQQADRYASDKQLHLRVVMRSGFLKGFQSDGDEGVQARIKLEQGIDSEALAQGKTIEITCASREIQPAQINRFAQYYMLGQYEPFETVTEESTRRATQWSGESHPYACVAKRASQLRPEALAELRNLDFIDRALRRLAREIVMYVMRAVK